MKETVKWKPCPTHPTDQQDKQETTAELNLRLNLHKRKVYEEIRQDPSPKAQELWRSIQIEFPNIKQWLDSPLP